MPFGVLSSIVNAMSADEQARKQYFNNKKLMEMQQAFDASEAAKNRQFQYQMYDMDRIWNDYESQRDRMEKAGLNPAMMFSDGQLAPTTSTPAGAQGSSGLASVGIGQGLNLNGYSFKEISEAIKNLADAEKSGADTANARAALDGILAESEIKKVQSLFTKDLNEKQLKECDARIAKLYQDVQLAIAQGDAAAADAKLKESQEKLVTSQKGLTDKQIEYQKAVNSVAVENLRAQINNINADTRNKEASTGYTKEQTKYVGYNAKTGRISANASLWSAYSQSEVNRAIEELTDKQKELLNFEIDKVRKDAGLSKIVEDMNDNEIVQFLIQSKYLVNQIPVLGNVLDALGSQGGKEVAKKLIK